MENFDYIIIGAGSAGCVLANRLSANSKNKVLSWDLLMHMLSIESTLMAAMNGNGPVRASTYETSEMKNKISYSTKNTCK